MMNHPHLAQFQAYLIRSTEANRIEFEKEKNLLRLIAYNNRRIRAGLDPVEYPGFGVSDFPFPSNRDDFLIIKR